MATSHELKAQAEQLLKQAEEARKREITEAVAEIKAKMQEYGITAADMGFSAGRKSATTKKAAVVRYRSPTGETWSGAGRQPQWLKAQIDAGKKKEDFAV